MATFLMPRVAFAPAFCAPSRRSSYRPFAAPRVSVNPLLSLVDDTINQLTREATRQAHQQQTFNARFDIREDGEGYHVDGEVPGFEQESIDIEVSDEFTLKISGSTEKKPVPQTTESHTQAEPGKMEVETAETAHTTEQASDHHSETSSVKSYQPTVEDDYEDLGADSDTMASTSPKGKERATEELKAPSTAVTQSQAESQTPVQEPQHRRWLSERSYGSFTRTFRFPNRIDGTNVRASLRNGLLSVTVPKAPVPQARQIMIQ